MRLLFLRHGQAGNRAEWPHPDAERPLTKRGVEETRAAAAGMRGLDLGIELVLTSPLVRAHQTALITAESLGLSVSIAPGLASGCTLATFAETMAEHAPLPRPSSADAGGQTAADPPLPRRVLLVGHEPDFSDIIGQMVGQRGAAAITLKKGALCRVDLDPEVDGWRWAPANLRGSATLAWLLTAKHLSRLGKA